MSSRLPILVLARGGSAPIREAWKQLRSPLLNHRALEVVQVLDEGDDGEVRVGDAELAVVIGGDGSILRACRSFGSRQIPILGVNAGRLGFLTDVSPSEFLARLDSLGRREFSIARHLMFECEHHRGDGTMQTYLGLNETAILAAGALQMIEVHLEIDEQLVTIYSGDGLIISTPVGSTAHSLSAGGPILRQDLQAFVVTPVCPHTLTMRPLIDSSLCRYRLTVPGATEGVMLVVDGQIKERFGPQDTAVIREAPVKFQLARLPGHSFYGTLYRKLGWAGQPQYAR